MEVVGEAGPASLEIPAVGAVSVRVLSWVWDHSQAAGNDRLVLLAIADNANDEGTCWPGVALLAHKTRLHPRTVQRCIASLRKMGELGVEFNKGGKDSWRRDKRPNLYTVTGYVAGRQIVTPLAYGVAEMVERGDRTTPDGVAPVSPKPSFNHQESSSGDRRSDPSDQRLPAEWAAEARAKLKSVPRKAKKPRRRAS